MSDLTDHELVQMTMVRLGKLYPVPPIPESAVDETLEAFRTLSLYDELSELEWKILAKLVKSQVKITMDAGTTLTAPDHVDWLAGKHLDIDWKRWVSYKQLLISKGFAPSVIATLDESTSEILNCLGDPGREGSWKRRGLVIGDVQSGKTATYLGVVNRAADAGYKLVILLAGGTEALRKQTQLRVDEGLLGRDTANANRGIGVATWHGNFVSAQAMTTQETDFRKSSKEATSFLVDPAAAPLVFVVKKNKTALENIRDWINEQRIGGAPLDVPMLLVDDESDYASVNTKEEDEPTRINSLIREILATATKTSYLAFTATPFANVFIDHETADEALGDDLFPRDYIRTLEAPTNYVGSSLYFGSEDAQDSSKLLSLADATEVFPHKHKSHLSVTQLPASLRAALRAFVVASAIREHRGDSSPRSMLVNVSRFKNVQAQVHALVEAEFERIKAAVELHAAGLAVGGGEHAELAALRESFEGYYGVIGLDWADVVGSLKSAVHGTGVRLINSDRVKRAHDLGEIETDRMIAVGGDVLSRGLTLEGLTVSYFHRQVGASDTLLQMARWFGYRPGYEDLCRVWMEDEVADQFRYVAGIVKDLRAQLRVMKKQGLTPRDFGLRVRMHPESLLITARNKMKAAEAKAYTINIAGAKNLETVRVDSDPEHVAANHKVVEGLVADIESGRPDAAWNQSLSTVKGVRDVDREIIARFLESYIGFAGDPIFADSALADFVRSGPAKYDLWTVGFIAGGGAVVNVGSTLTLRRPRRAVASGHPVQIGQTMRFPFRVSGSSSRLAGSTDVANAAGVTGEEPYEPGVFQHMKQPALLIYLIELTAKKSKDGAGNPSEDKKAVEMIEGLQEVGLDHVVGVKVGIPGTPGDKGAEVKYMLNSVALNAWVGATLEEPISDLSGVDGVDDE